MSQLQVGLTCWGRAECDSNGSNFLLRRISVDLEDLKPPEILAASGSLVEPGRTLRGLANVALKLRDVGGGVHKVRVEADGQRVSEQLVEDGRSTCRPPFVAPVPCPLTAAVDVPIDTLRLAEGERMITVKAFDATGVNSATHGPVRVLVDNLPDPPPALDAKLTCPSTAAIGVTRRLRKSVISYDDVNWLSGRVRGPATGGLQGMRVALIDRSGLRRSGVVSRVDRRGRYRLRLRRQAPGHVRPILLASSGHPVACGMPVLLRVRAGIRLMVTPRRLRNGQTVTLRGRVGGIRSAGTRVMLQARAEGAPVWTTVTVLQSRGNGSFAFRYRFRRTFARTTYVFRAVSPRQRGHAYLRGSSAAQRAVVGP